VGIYFANQGEEHGLILQSRVVSIIVHTEEIQNVIDTL